MINKQMILINEPVNGREEAINLLADQAVELGKISEKEPFVQAVNEREKMNSTAFEFNIAIPHGKSGVVNEPFISYLSVKQPINWDDDGNNEVKYMFLIGVPEEGGSQIHLKYISEVSKKLLDEDFRRELFNSETVEQAYDLLSSINKNIKK